MPQVVQPQHSIFTIEPAPKSSRVPLSIALVRFKREKKPAPKSTYNTKVLHIRGDLECSPWSVQVVHVLPKKRKVGTHSAALRSLSDLGHCLRKTCCAVCFTVLMAVIIQNIALVIYMQGKAVSCRGPLTAETL